ncbi:MAG: protein kinase domain-containing protein [Thermoanaerobaculia bacterium]
MFTAIGRYEILERIGQGAMGEVYKARDTVLTRFVAVKTIAAAARLRWDDSLTERFRREAQAAAGLNHPNIITVHDFGEEQGTFYMAMELLDGIDLTELVRRRMPAALEDRLGLIEQICDGVAFAHAHKVIHRDLKPANIHVLANGTVKILDFGLARSEDLQVTRSGGLLGTPYYMSPEQVRGERVDARSDVFSLGSLFYELLTHRRPFPAESVHAVLFQVLEREPEPLRTSHPEIPAVLDAAVRKALDKIPDRRFQDAGELREALRRVRGVMAGEVPESEVLAAFGLAAMAAGPAPVPPPAVSLPPAAASLGGSAMQTFALSRPFRVTFHGESGGDRILEVANPGMSLLDLALKEDIPHFHECGGRGRCSTCRVRVLSGAQGLQPRTPSEARLAGRLGWPEDIRLACQTRVTGDVSVQRLILDQEDLSLLHLETGPQAASPQESALVVMSCGLRGFQDFARAFPPYDVFHVLNRYCLQMGEPIVDNGGTITWQDRDGTSALFGLDGGEARGKCLASVRAALRMAARMEEVARYARDHFGAELALSVGLHFGRTVVGQVGHPSKRQLTAIGEVPDLAGRVLEVARAGGAILLATEDVINIVEEDVRVGRVFQDESPGGRARDLYEILDFHKEDSVFLTQTSFEAVARQREAAAELFYRLLFEIDPSARGLFAVTDMQAQGDMLMSVLAAAVKGLDRIEDLVPVLQDLGRRHAGYGVGLRHYDSVEQALLEMVRQMLGEAFSLDIRLAWSRTYNRLAKVMIEAAG